MPHAFLSDDWIAAAREIRQRHAGEVAPITIALKMNLLITGAPFGDDPIKSYVDTSSGALVMELGQLDDADVTVTTDYDTAKSLFLATDPAAGMQAFMAGKLVVQGDMMKLVALPQLAAADPVAQAASAEIREMTE
jgi:SCP-2 sterol transfer family